MVLKCTVPRSAGRIPQFSPVMWSTVSRLAWSFELGSRVMEFSWNPIGSLQLTLPNALGVTVSIVLA
eukprot:4195796-Ditylum_brightwellii.AAC.1